MPGYSQSQTQKDLASLVPVITSLLQEQSSIRLRVGQHNTYGYHSDRYPDGIEFFFGKLDQDIRLTIEMENISNAAQLEIYINGVLVGELQNGVNGFDITASELTENTILIKLKADTTGSWSLVEIFGVLKNGPTTRAEAQLFLARATFGPTKAELDRVLEIGYEAWIDEQLNQPRVSSSAMYIADLAANQAARRNELNESNWRQDSNCRRDGINTLQQCIDIALAILEGSASSRTRMDGWWQRVIRGNDQLRQRVVYALSQIMVISDELGNSLATTRSLTFYEDILAQHAFGNYFDLIKGITLNPAMGRYLSFVGNQKSGRFGEPDENYAREIMQLFSIGLIKLKLDGTPDLVDGKEVETYNQDTIRNLARVFTGWTFHNGSFVFDEWDLLPMVVWANGSFHDFGSKTLLNGHVNSAGLSQEQDLDLALKNIFDHPNVGPFMAKRLIERLVMSNPPPAYVARVATVFNNNGNGERGDLGAVIKAILLDPVAINSPSNPTGGKIKEPVIGVAQVWRAFNAQSDIDAIRYANPARELGQRPFSAPTVFNFYAPDDAPPAIAEAGLVAPEFTLYTDAIVPLLLSTMNNIATSAKTGNDDLGNGSHYSTDSRRAMILNLNEAEQLADDLNDLLDFYDERLLGGLMSARMRSVMIAYLAGLDDQGSAAANRKHRATEALTVLLVSPEYNYQR